MNILFYMNIQVSCYQYSYSCCVVSKLSIHVHMSLKILVGLLQLAIPATHMHGGVDPERAGGQNILRGAWT